MPRQLREPPQQRLFKKPIETSGEDNDSVQQTYPVLDKEAMKGIMNIVSTNDPRDSDLTAGMTYIGQLITHDIVPPTREGNRPRAFIEQDTISTKLNLDSLYGNNDFQKNPRYFSQNGKFYLGRAKDSAYGTDVLRLNGQVCIPDIRNDENVIISQLHLFWQKFHNKVVDTYFNGNVGLGSDTFQLVRHFVISVFHRIVIDEFLFQLLQPDIYQVYCIERQLFLLNDDPMKDLPREFSHAAFRIGHSMVRSHYKLQQNGAALGLKELFIKPDQHNQSIEAKHIIDWYLLFGRVTMGYLNSQNASRIDLKLTKPMCHIPVVFLNDGLNMIRANLDAGERAELLPGAWFVDQIKADKKFAAAVDMTDHKDPTYAASPLKSLEAVFPVKKLPLWAYVLVENDASDKTDWERRGHTASHMGKVGSIIIAEVLMKSMAKVTVDSDVKAQLDKFYLRLGHSTAQKQTTKPTDSKTDNGKTHDGSRLSMLDLLHFVNF